MIQIIIRMARITHVPHLFSIKHIFLEVNTASLSIQKKEKKKKFEFEQPSWLHKIQLIKIMCLIDNSKYEPIPILHSKYLMM